MALDPYQDEEQARAAAEVAARLRQRGIALTGAERPDDLANLLSAVERFEAVVEAHGGDLMVDDLKSSQPDDSHFVVPRRGHGETVRADVFDHLECRRLIPARPRPPGASEPAIHPRGRREGNGATAIRALSQRDIAHRAERQTLGLSVDQTGYDDRSLIRQRVVGPRTLKRVDKEASKHDIEPDCDERNTPQRKEAWCALLEYRPLPEDGEAAPE